jgi:hypothetical protein
MKKSSNIESDVVHMTRAGMGEIAGGEEAYQSLLTFSEAVDYLVECRRSITTEEWLASVKQTCRVLGNQLGLRLL